MKLLTKVPSLRVIGRPYNGGGWPRSLFVLLTIGALMIQALCVYYEAHRRTLQTTVGIKLDLDLDIVPDSGAGDPGMGLTYLAQQSGFREQDRILALDGQPVPNILAYRRVLDSYEADSMVVLTVLRDGQRMELPAIRVGTMPLDILVLFRFVAGLAFLLVGAAVALLSSREHSVAEKRRARLFFLACLFLGLYVSLVQTRITDLIYVQAVALALAPAAVIHFFLSFPVERALVRSPWVWLLYAPSLALMILTVSAFDMAVQAGTGTYQAPLFALLSGEIGFGYLQLSGIFGLAMMAYVYATTSDPVQRRQLQWIMLGLACAIVPAAVDLILTLRAEHSVQTSRWLLLGFLPIPITFAFAILRYRLWDVDLVLSRSVVYGLLTAALAAVYLLLVSGLSTALGLATGGRGDSAYPVVLFLSALLIGLLVNPLRSRLQAVIDRVFFRRQVDHQAALARWSEELATSLRFSNLARLLLQEVPERLQIERAWLLVLDQEERYLEALSVAETPPGSVGDLSVPVHSGWAVRLARPDAVLMLHDEAREYSAGGSGSLRSSLTESWGKVLGELGPAGSAALAEWTEAGVDLALPLVSGGHAATPALRTRELPGAEPGDAGLEDTRLVGFYLLGHKLSGDIYQRQEMEFLRTLSNQAAVAIANARLYEQVRGLSEELELKVQERTKELRDFVSVVFHELSTPITSIRGFTDLLLDKAREYSVEAHRQGGEGALSLKQVRYLNTIKRNVGRLMRLVDDLSDVSKIEDGRLTVHPEPLDLHDVLSETMGSLTSIIEEKGLQVTAAIPADVGTVYGDRYRVVQILTNLVGNACRYTPAGGQITVAATRIDGGAGDASPTDSSLREGRSSGPGAGSMGWVELTVTDTGIGIHKHDLPRIFERFYRSEDPLVREHPGTGLGLAITKSLVELHGSHLWVNSSVGKGSIFGFALPLAGLGHQVAQAEGGRFQGGADLDPEREAVPVEDGYGAG